jgi:hypothetical protein
VQATLVAQVTASAAVAGVVRDKNQAVVPNASVTITNKDKGLSRSTTTNANGEYKFDFIPAGRYDVKVSASGFGDRAVENFDVLVGKTNNVDFHNGTRYANCERHSDGRRSGIGQQRKKRTSV